tara:strand:+ start:813 stop:1280 length:468 start_codon:yes stop_codon:yes gene_type:complete
LNNSRDFQWKCLGFRELNSHQLHQILKMRQQIFIIEQKCIYEDIDEFDKVSHHIQAINNGKLLAYSRVLPAGSLYAEVSIGRVMVSKTHRNRGLGRKLMQKSHEWCESNYRHCPIRLNAQYYLESFYHSFHYQTVSKPYDDEGVLHIEMYRPGIL